jgi:predicted nucleotidyltransferase component of viral defense system
MLQKETVAPNTLELLKLLMQDDHLKDFILVGGTALSLQLRHRISIDLDFFSQLSFDEQSLSQYLEKEKGLQLDFLHKNTVKGQIAGIKLDFITHPYPSVREPLLIDNIRMASLEDIAAMKLNAIAGNGTRLKDFIDIAFLSGKLTLQQMLEAYAVKYGMRNPFIPLKALSYFNDINQAEPVNLITGKLQWSIIEKRIKEMINSPGNIFIPL